MVINSATPLCEEDAGSIQVEFCFDIEPVGQLRPRFSRRGKAVVVYDPKKVADFKKEVRAVATELAQSEPLSSILPFAKGVPLEVTLKTHHTIPKSWTKTQTGAASGNWKVTKSDVDNEIKSILDSLNGILWHDDNQIARIVAEKRYVETTTRYTEREKHLEVQGKPYFTVEVKTL